MDIIAKYRYTTLLFDDNKMAQRKVVILRTEAAEIFLNENPCKHKFGTPEAQNTVVKQFHSRYVYVSARQFSQYPFGRGCDSHYLRTVASPWVLQLFGSR